MESAIGEGTGGVPLERVQVENFGCLQNVEVTLEPLTVLVGANDSGKSMFLQALLTLSHALDAENGWGTVFRDAATLNARTFDGSGGAIRFQQEGRVGGLPYSYEEQVDAQGGVIRTRAGHFTCGPVSVWRAPDGIWRRDPQSGSSKGPYPWGDHETPLLHPRRFTASPGQPEEFKRLARYFQPTLPVLDALTSLQLYALRPEHLRTSRRHGEPEVDADGVDHAPRLGRFGGGLANAIAELLLSGRDVLEGIEEALRRAMPQVKRVDVRRRPSSTQGDGYSIELVARSGTRIPSHAISDGILLFLGYLYLVLGPDPAAILLIEEPETGIHPGLLRRLMQLFRDMSTGLHGRPPTQILLTSHSPVLLNLVRPDEIRVFERGEDGATRVTPFLHAPDTERLLDDRGPGERWLDSERWLDANAAALADPGER
ncbi:AAA family ATPase [Chondromyces crocatus]|uniref:ATPase AAA-type core domain-containing protein n=1 Tax=Chondromyces crocatus TaxID=52 RepID=A0A0K1ENF8_CHOCO|nr:ATP-binding protein [Chondromyces crocatus]AKT42381.1 uncharacterized protein CMC5_066070 [Chondromyces crocatus]